VLEPDRSPRDAETAGRAGRVFCYEGQKAFRDGNDGLTTRSTASERSKKWVQGVRADDSPRIAPGPSQDGGRFASTLEPEINSCLAAD